MKESKSDEEAEDVFDASGGGEEGKESATLELGAFVDEALMDAIRTHLENRSFKVRQFVLGFKQEGLTLLHHIEGANG